MVHEEWNADPHGPGYQRTGRRYVEDGYVRLPADGDDECRCAHCGTPAVVLSIMRLAGISYRHRETTA